MTIDYDAAALAAARRYCGWIVTPPVEEVITVDGPGGRVLSLPTMQLTEVTAVVEDGTALDVTTLRWSVTRGQIYKKSGACWTSAAGAISVSMTHGYETAPDFDAAVAQASLSLASAGTRTDLALKSKKVDDVTYEWYQMASSYLPESLLAPYRILQSP